MKLPLQVVASLALSLFAVCAANGQATRTWVSGVGDDTNPCSRTAPCISWAGAFAKTASGGEIDVIDPGDFGPLTITHAITIDGSAGNVAGSSPSSTNGIVINASTSSAVTLRNLSINGVRQTASPGINGVLILQAKDVHIENSVISGFSNSGVNAVTASAGQIVIDHSTIRDNTVSGITFGCSSGTLLANVSNSTLTNNGVGLLASGNSKVTVQNSVAGGNNGAGIQADASTGAATVSVLNTISVNNTGAGLMASSSGASSAVIRVSGVGLFSNGSGLSIGANGNIFSYGDNEVTGGGTVTGTLAKQ